MRTQRPLENLSWWEREQATWPNRDVSRFVEAGGIRWHVQEMGTGPQLLLVHGTGASTHSWRDVMPLLARRFSVLAVDLPGHAFTDSLSASRSSIAGFAESLAALLAVLEFHPEYCVGHSAGAVVLCRMSLDQSIFPRVIISINGAFIPLWGAAGRLLSPVARLLASNSLVAQLMARRSEKARARVARIIASTGSKIDEAGIELYARLARNPGHVAGALRMMANWDLYEFGRALPRLTVPLCLIAADNDLMVSPAQALMVQRRIANGVVLKLASLGHLAHEEEPVRVAEELSTICSKYPP